MCSKGRMWKSDTREPIHTHMSIGVFENPLCQKNEPDGHSDENRATHRSRVFKASHGQIDATNLGSFVLAAAKVFNQMLRSAQGKRKNTDCGCFVGAV